MARPGPEGRDGIQVAVATAESPSVFPDMGLVAEVMGGGGFAPTPQFKYTTKNSGVMALNLRSVRIRGQVVCVLI